MHRAFFVLTTQCVICFNLHGFALSCINLCLVAAFYINLLSGIVYFLSSLGAETAAQKVGFPPTPERAPKSAQNRTFWHSLWESAETPLFEQINVFAFSALRLHREYTSLVAVILRLFCDIVP